MTTRGGRRRAQRRRIAGLVAVLMALATACGGDDGEAASRSDDAPVEDTDPAPSTEAGGVTAAEVQDLLLEDPEGSLLRADETAGPPEARCVAERWVRDMTPDELEAIGLPDDLDGATTILADVDGSRRFFDPLFDCLDMRAFLAGQLDDLPPVQAQCVAERVATDEDVRLMFLIGTTDGSDPPGPWRALQEETMDRLGAYTLECA